ncbi:MAG: hypothetical protein K2F74_04980, partial [Muribaculaceae bacterium]|nr:hypothetical protein [Muribaculaceae bacterium]MDE6130926.1 hypothetical protein [Muribaculaceae bacterium]
YKYHRLGHSLALFSILLSHSAKALLLHRMKKITQRLTALALTFIVEPALGAGQHRPAYKPAKLRNFQRFLKSGEWKVNLTGVEALEILRKSDESDESDKSDMSDLRAIPVGTSLCDVSLLFGNLLRSP